jgi:ribosomal protein S12 methylthiotransferase accessory factor
VVTGDLTELLDHVLDELRRCGIGDIIAVPLGGEEMGISVIKLFAEGLEDRAPNHNWRPGKRAIAAAMGLI